MTTFGKATYLFCSLAICLLCSAIKSLAFDDEHETHEHNQATQYLPNTPAPKDKVLLRAIDKLVFYRHKRTTSRRTHPIHQLTCVGGTAGCKLFTPGVVECENVGYDHKNRRQNWRCHADMSERVKFNHVEVICEGYDYPEDDHILLGSCGLEFTLDYTDPADYHHFSYYKHMDEHEKSMHQERLKSKSSDQDTLSKATYQTWWAWFRNYVIHTHNLYFISGLVVFGLSLTVFLIYYLRGDPSKMSVISSAARRKINYVPQASAVLVTKKAC